MTRRPYAKPIVVMLARDARPPRVLLRLKHVDRVMGAERFNEWLQCAFNGVVPERHARGVTFDTWLRWKVGA